MLNKLPFSVKAVVEDLRRCPTYSDLWEGKCCLSDSAFKEFDAINNSPTIQHVPVDVIGRMVVDLAIGTSRYVYGTMELQSLTEGIRRTGDCDLSFPSLKEHVVGCLEELRADAQKKMIMVPSRESIEFIGAHQLYTVCTILKAHLEQHESLIEFWTEDRRNHLIYHAIHSEIHFAPPTVKNVVTKSLLVH
jgi:hypothetical protein